MEAARTLTSLPERMRRRRFTEACEELRPLGIAYVLRRFGGSLDRADAEDVVAEVIIRFDRLDAAGRPPERLRPAFFQSCRNAALDHLRYRGVRPTAPLEAAEWEPTDAPGPEEHAESHENVVRLREAMARMRPNYREAIVLRFGLDLSVPEIAEQVGISLPAAKKLVLRSTAQIRDRMEAIEERSFCPEMREIAERSVIDGELAGVSDRAESAAVKAHLEHCGACRGFLAALRSNLHELGGTVLLGGIAAGKLGLASRLTSGFHTAVHGAQAGIDRVRLASYRAGGALRPEGADSAGLLAGAGQKVAAVCTAGVAGAATCAATGILGPGIGLTQPHQPHHHAPAPPAHVREAPKPTHRPLLTYSEPESEGAGAPTEPEGASPSSTATPTAPRPRGEASAGKTAADPKKKSAQHTETKPETAGETVQSQFGIEEESSSPPVEVAPVETHTPVAEARTVEPSTSSSSSPSTSSSSPSSGEASKSSGSSGGGHDEFGFGG
jgi:RNA polymerase sigma-70 factor (ECF subfamily)